MSRSLRVLKAYILQRSEICKYVTVINIITGIPSARLDLTLKGQSLKSLVF